MTTVTTTDFRPGTRCLVAVFGSIEMHGTITDASAHPEVLPDEVAVRFEGNCASSLIPIAKITGTWSA